MTSDGTWTVVQIVPECDICHDEPARFDGVTTLGSAWAFMCQLCFLTYGVGLGTGVGQRLLTQEEVDELDRSEHAEPG